MGTCVSSTDINDNDKIIISLEKILNTDHSTNKHLSLLLNNKLATVGLSNPYGNKNIPDKIVEYAKQKYNKIKKKIAGEINYNTNIIINSFIEYFRYIYNTLTHNIITKCKINNINLIDFIASEYSYYAKYLLSIFNTIEGLDNIIYIGTECSVTTIEYNMNYAYSILISTNDIIEQILPDTYDSFTTILNKLVAEYPDIEYDALVNFIKNIKIIERIKDKLIFSHKYETESFIKNEGTDHVKNKFIINLYEEYLQDNFRLIIIEDDNSYKVGLEYKE